MLTFTQEQMAAMQARRFQDKVLVILRKTFPDHAPADSPETRAQLGALVGRARGHAIFSQPDTARYICLSYLLGTEFDTRLSAARDILAERSHPAEERLTLLETWASEFIKTLQGKRTR